MCGFKVLTLCNQRLRARDVAPGSSNTSIIGSSSTGGDEGCVYLSWQSAALIMITSPHSIEGLASSRCLQ